MSSVAANEEQDEWSPKSALRTLSASLSSDSGSDESDDESAAERVSVDPVMLELYDDGALVARCLDPAVATSVASKLALWSQIPDEIDDATCAEVMLSLLEEEFIPLQGYNWEEMKPSHSWKNAERCAPWGIALQLVRKATKVLAMESILLRLESPAFVAGDLHGNYKDTVRFTSLLGFGRGARSLLVPANLIFLGDYVDRGPHSVETLLFLLALKVKSPNQVFLLRGNHECRSTNRAEETYGDFCFWKQCLSVYGETQGTVFWDLANVCFDNLPLALVLDGAVLCVHGGVPRPCRGRMPALNIVAALKKPLDPDDMHDKHDADVLVRDLLWADPATTGEEELLRELGRKFGFPPGYGPSTRGPDVIVFGKEALNRFCADNDVTHIVRAHQVFRSGIAISKDARVVTVFTSSHYRASNCAAIVLVHQQHVRCIVARAGKCKPPSANRGRTMRTCGSLSPTVSSACPSTPKPPLPPPTWPLPQHGGNVVRGAPPTPTVASPLPSTPMMRTRGRHCGSSEEDTESLVAVRLRQRQRQRSATSKGTSSPC
eukprot:TRINITY_DN3714_c0_g1_i6.p1 TRINITY_DN3714_c0_g1~~TRINITY_DN3714_c0_g1_i6.p1  ORF type:complete len:547 (+),score=96.93 TRINITY_DN3714_c0_g1_i6:66-1706(+)